MDTVIKSTVKFHNAIWVTAFGERRKFSELDHQHLSNILWFNEVFRGWTRYNNETQFHLGLELVKFGGERLKWRPLPIPNEIVSIKEFCEVDDDGFIHWQGKIIGSVNHIPGWKEA